MGVYKVEPYVVTADVYAVPPHVGRGGWSWYTGSSGWMYRLIMESVLGISIAVDKLSFAPRLPTGWTGFKIGYRFRATVYTIEVKVGGPPQLVLDGVAMEGATIPLVDDQKPHTVELTLS